MVIFSRMFISSDFLMYPMLSHKHFLQQSSYDLKAIANSSMPMFRWTPSQIFLRLSRVKTMPASSSFAF